jgi:hypothetical protein
MFVFRIASLTHQILCYSILLIESGLQNLLKHTANNGIRPSNINTHYCLSSILSLMISEHELNYNNQYKLKKNIFFFFIKIYINTNTSLG